MTVDVDNDMIDGRQTFIINGKTDDINDFIAGLIEKVVLLEKQVSIFRFALIDIKSRLRECNSFGKTNLINMIGICIDNAEKSVDKLLKKR